MDYILKQFDKPLIKFSATTDTSEPEIQILWADEESKTLFPPPCLTMAIPSLTLPVQTHGLTSPLWRNTSKRCTPACMMTFSARRRAF